MKIYDDIDALQIRIGDKHKADRVLAEQIKLVNRYAPYTFVGALISGICFFLLMYGTIELDLNQLILNSVWILYHSAAIILCWYCLSRINCNPSILSINFTKRVFVGICLFLSITVISCIIAIAIRWYYMPVVNSIKITLVFWIVLLLMNLYLCLDSWKSISDMVHKHNLIQNSMVIPVIPNKFSAIKSQQQSSNKPYQSTFLSNYAAYKILLVCVFMIGSLWAMAISRAVVTNIDYFPQVTVMMGLHFGLLGGAISSIGIFWRIYIALALPSLLSWSISLIFIGEPRLLILSWAVLTLLFLNIFFSKYAWVNTLKTILINLENTQLLEQLKIKSKQVEKANLAKSRFLASASHDLRQPAHALSLFLEALSSTSLNEHQLQIVNYAKTASQSSREMLTTILDYTHLESKERIPHIVPTDLNSVIQNLIDEFSMQANNKGLSLRYHPTSIYVMSDPAMLSLILRNFISNALRYTDNGGVLIGVRKLDTGYQTLLIDYCRLSVWDTGGGISPDELETIFDSFHQLKRNNKNNQGLGLGLSIAKGMANLLNAPITVKSTLQRGTCFSVDLPVCNDAYKFGSFDDFANNQQTLFNKTILVVDDVDSVLKSMRLLLQSWGCKVLVAATLSEAVNECALNKPQIVIADFRLANFETGEEVIIAINDLGYKPVRFLILTGDTSPEIEKVAHKVSVNVLYKPIDPKKLRLLLTKLASSIDDEQEQITSCETKAPKSR